MPSITRENHEVLTRLGSAFASIREEVGLTQAELAEATRLHVNTISNIERGLCEASIFSVGLLCLALGCPRIRLGELSFIPEPGPRGIAPPKDFPELVWKPGAIAVHSASFRTRRLEAGLSLRALAASAAVHPNTIWNYEHAQVALSASAAFRLYRALGVNSIGGPEGILN
ncbi:MAG TPA: hypothetical protein DCG47_13930 [Spirochaetaceae bacterium]|nr:hypothetical protein [Spirochaetaceae bacterium]